MNKKTFFKISATALILGVSITLSVKYFPAVALAIKSGVIASAAPLVAFAIFTIIALASAAAFIKYVVSAIRSKDTKGKSNGVSGEAKSKEEGQSLVQEEVAPTPTPPLLPQAPEKLVIPDLQQQPVDNSVKGTETPQPEKDDAASAICNKSKPSNADERSQNENPDKERSLVNEEKQAVTASASPLIPHVTEKLTGAVLQRQPVDNSVKGTETPQPEKDDAASAICNKSKPSNADERSQNENPDKERSLVNEEKQAVTASASPLIPHVTEKLTGAVLQRQPVDNSVKGTETMQPGKDGGVVVNGDSAEQQTIPKSLNSLLPEYPPMSPLDTEKQNQLPPTPPSSIHGEPLNTLDQSLQFLPSRPSANRLNWAQQSCNIYHNKNREIAFFNLRTPDFFNTTSSESSLSSSTASLSATSLQSNQSCDSLSDESNLLSIPESMVVEGSVSNPQMPVPIYDVNNQGTNTSVVSQSDLSYGSLDNVKDVLDYRQSYYYDDNESSILESTIVEESVSDDNESSILESMIVEESVSSDQRPQAPVVRSNASTYDVNNRIFDSINLCPTPTPTAIPTATPTPIVVEYDVHNGRNLNNNGEAYQYYDDDNNYQGFYMSADCMVNIPPNTITSSNLSKESPCLNKENGPKERLLNVKLNAHSVVHDNSRSVVHGNSRSN